jgi:hypothetical protein
MQATDNEGIASHRWKAIPDLVDPSHHAVRADLARLFITHKADPDLVDCNDAEIVARVDDIAWHLWQRVALAILTPDAAFIERFGWLCDAMARLHADQGNGWLICLVHTQQVNLESGTVRTLKRGHW